MQAMLAARHSKLEGLIGERIELSVTGTLTDPKINWQDVFGDLVKKTIDKRIRDEITDPIDILLGKGKDDPQDLLNRADKLWSEGKKAEARLIYKTLGKKYKLTLVYVLNKSRIKKRSKGD